MPTLIFILILSFLVIIHELGHFFAAKRAKMKVEEFGLGYPPLALKLFKWQGTTFSLNWIPFGGFVRIEGEENNSGVFHKFAINKRLSVILAGAIVNFIFGVIAFSFIYSFSGVPLELKEARIAAVAPNSPAENAGLQVTTNILGFKINDEFQETKTTQAVIDKVTALQGQDVVVVTSGPCEQLECSSAVQEYAVYLRKPAEIPDGQGSLGVVFQPVIYFHYPWYEMPLRGIWYGLIQAFWLGQMILQGLGDLLINLVTLGQVPNEIAGPIGIVHQATTEGIFTEGAMAILSFAGMLSINLAILNILPIPALDGGRAVFILIEKFSGRKKIEKIEYYANYAGYILLLGLLILVTIRDVVQIFI